MRVNDLIAGVKGDVAVKVYGDDLDADAATSRTRSARRVAAGPRRRRHEDGDRHGAPVDPRRRRSRARRPPRRSAAQRARRARDGARRASRSGVVREGERVFDLVAPPRRRARSTTSAISRACRSPPSKATSCPLSMVADVKAEDTVVQSVASRCERRLIVQTNVRGRDMVGFVKDAQAKVGGARAPEDRRARVGRAVPELQPRQDAPRAARAGLDRRHRADARLHVPQREYMLITLLNLPFAIAGGVFALVAARSAVQHPGGRRLHRPLRRRRS